MMVSPPPARREDDDGDNDGNKDDDDLSRDRRRAERGEGDVNDGVDNEHVDGRVRGPCLVNTNGHRGATETTMMMSRRVDRIPPH
jgi:hypothetical protein